MSRDRAISQSLSDFPYLNLMEGSKNVSDDRLQFRLEEKLRRRGLS
jgi:hypothetical protein